MMIKSKVWLEDYTVVFSPLDKEFIEKLISAGKNIPVQDVFGSTKEIIPNQVSSIESVKDDGK